jgi:hypothetical protein
MVTTLVFVAQYFRGLSNKFKYKVIKALESRIEAVQAEQVEVEEHRSSQMIDCHNRYYASRDDLNARQVKEAEEMLARHQQERDNLKADFEDNKASIALVHQAASDSLKKEIVMREMELDNLTK